MAMSYPCRTKIFIHHTIHWTKYIPLLNQLLLWLTPTFQSSVFRLIFVFNQNKARNAFNYIHFFLLVWKIMNIDIFHIQQHSILHFPFRVSEVWNFISNSKINLYAKWNFPKQRFLLISCNRFMRRSSKVERKGSGRGRGVHKQKWCVEWPGFLTDFLFMLFIKINWDETIYKTKS